MKWPRRRWVVIEDGTTIVDRRWTERRARARARSLRNTDTIAMLFASRLMYGKGKTIDGLMRMTPHEYTVERVVG